MNRTNAQAEKSAEEKYLPLVDAVEEATGRRPHLTTCLRWCTRGTRNGVRLSSRVLGGRRLTTVDAVRDYMNAATNASVGGMVEPLHQKDVDMSAMAAPVDASERVRSTVERLLNGGAQ